MCDGDRLTHDRYLARVIAAVLGADVPDVQVVFGGQLEARVRRYHDALGRQDVVHLLPD